MHAAGFSLIELLIASVIIALTASLLVGGLMSANRSAELRARKAFAGQLLASRLSLIDERIASTDTQQGGFAGSAADASWQLAPADTAIGPLKALNLTVTHEGQSVHASTLRLLKEQQ